MRWFVSMLVGLALIACGEEPNKDPGPLLEAGEYTLFAVDHGTNSCFNFERATVTIYIENDPEYTLRFEAYDPNPLVGTVVDDTLLFSEEFSGTYDYQDGQYVDGDTYTWTCSSEWLLEPYDSKTTVEMTWTANCYQPVPEDSCDSNIHGIGSLVEE